MGSGDRDRNPTIYRVSCAAASTQYSQLLATGTRSIKLQARAATNLVWVGWASGVVTGTSYWTNQANTVYEQRNLSLHQATIFVASPVTGAVVEIMAWQ
jgi:hypothetical protein